LGDVHIYVDFRAEPLPILHHLKEIVQSGAYSHAALFRTIAGPVIRGNHDFHIHDNHTHLLALMGGSDICSLARRSQHPERRTRWSITSALLHLQVPRELYNSEMTHTMSIATKLNALTDRLVYLVHLDILADANAHHVLCLLGQSEFSKIPGWLSESLSTILVEHAACRTETPLRYVCTQAFDLQSDFNQILNATRAFWDESLLRDTGCANFKFRIYKIFGSVY